MLPARCQCCGIGVGGPRAQIRRCVICDLCDGLHGDALQIQCGKLVRSGAATPGHVLGRMMLDDAHLAGMLALVPCPTPEQPNAYGPWIPVAVPRWRVVVGRAAARGELPELGLIVQVVLARYIPGPATRAALDGIARDLGEALTTLDPNVVGVQVDSRRDTLDPEHLVINIEARTAATPGMVTVHSSAADVEIPPDIMNRPRGSA